MIDGKKIIQDLAFVRLAGTAGDRKARDIIIESIEKMGWEATLEPVNFKGFDTGTARVTVGETVFEAIPFGLNDSCRIEGELTYLTNHQQLHIENGRYEDHIIISLGYERNLTSALQRNKIKGYIAISTNPRDYMSHSHKQLLYPDQIINSVVVSYEDGATLSKLSGRDCRIEIEQTVTDRQSDNIVVHIPGNSSDRTVTYLTAHYDSVARSPGALDNGGGVACLLKILDQLQGKTFQRDLKVIFFAAEELGLIGSHAYIDQHQTEVRQQARLMINIDFSGDDLGVDKAVILGCRELLGYIDGITREDGICHITSMDIYSSDCMPFAVYEIPSINLVRSGGQGIHAYHTSLDTPEGVTNRGLEGNVKASMSILERVLNGLIYPTPRGIDSSLRPKLEKYVWNTTGHEPKLFWEKPYERI